MNRELLLKVLDIVDAESPPNVTPSAGTPYPVGSAVIVRTVTHYYTGRITEARDGFLILEDAAWVADTGRWSKALTDGVLTEVEPFPAGCAISCGAIIDVSPWSHALPLQVK